MFGAETNDIKPAGYYQACEAVIAANHASTSRIQRALLIGYGAAAKIIDIMEADGIVSAPNQQGRRRVLVSEAPTPPSGDT